VTRVAFYAPLKPPDHPVPSGDRRMAQAFVALLASLGHEVELACRLRSYDRDGLPARQERLGRIGRRVGERLAERYRGRPAGHRPDLWFTYHLYHKAPDWLGPTVARRLGIPYLVAEASLAARRVEGPWALGHAASREAVAAADLVLAMTRKDAAGLAPEIADPSRLLLFPPFLDASPFVAATRDRARLAAAHGLDPDRPWLLAVAMMRDDVKLLSYRLLAEALERLRALDWQLLLAGDGPARAAVSARFAGFPSDRVRFLGLLSAAALPAVYAAADLCVWPACAEAYGMALLEAQAAALPVVAGSEGGVADVIVHGETGLLCAGREVAAFADAVATLLGDAPRRRAMGVRAQRQVLALHDVCVARARLASALARLGLPSGDDRCASA
jgi:glycosyltransferase involved in cell wall biosynthesis